MTDLVHSGSASIPGGAEAAGATVLERAARALFESYSALAYPDEDDIESAEAVWDEGRHGFIESARAGLLAVRELPDEIIDEHLYDNEYGYAMYYEGWQPAIDAILADGEGR